MRVPEMLFHDPWEKLARSGGTSKSRNVSDINEEGSSSDSSGEEDTPRALSYRTPLITQA
ncbi:hypothetical protein CK203_019991 [Vitis vinifera]|uniref:Uncharacterized protein n=1 Tax=Vitis vinifera TaxID=29760 RepID=A0A438J2T2_VITVI|nr:hypothetical protein CK203_019991 [Vitis vinifera]